MLNEADAAYRVAWQGEPRMPRGAQIGNRVIAWTQSGIVTAVGNEQCGVYERIKDIEGPNKESEMLIFALPEKLLLPTLRDDRTMGGVRLTEYQFSEGTQFHVICGAEESPSLVVWDRDGSRMPRPEKADDYPYTNMMTCYIADCLEQVHPI